MYIINYKFCIITVIEIRA